MQIDELMLLIPDDGSLEIKNNSGTAVVSVTLYSVVVEEWVRSENLNSSIEGIIKRSVKKIIDYNKHNANS